MYEKRVTAGKEFMNHMKKGLLAVSFGTSVNETREKTIDAIERELAAACPDCQLYRAWTSRMIIRKLKQRDQVQIDTVKEAFARMLADGIKEDLEPQEALLLMGHGTEHHVNPVYAALDYMFKDLGYKNVHVGTVEAYPSLESALRLIRVSGVKEIRLAPFMVVAGDHAINDMAGEEEDSWKSRLEAEGYSVSCVMKGLGEYREIQNLYAEHAKNAKPL